ncbi:MAG: hypothetical protein DRI01_09495 [Chloroflexi bacterium]|nr:MAG: hypothetical protein DRI01_09495 [Chloroflexota bacterium]
MSYAWYNQLHPKIKEILDNLQVRTSQLLKQYGSLQKAGRPIFETEEEVAVIYYVAREVASYAEVAGYLNVTKQSVYNWIKTIETKNKIAIYDPKTGKVTTISFTPEKAKEIIGKITAPSGKKHVRDAMEAKCIQEFVNNPVKRTRRAHGVSYYSPAKVKQVVSKVQDLINFIKAKNLDVPSNPDMWEEDSIRRVIEMYCQEKYENDLQKVPRCIRLVKKTLRHIPKFSDWFKGEIGAEISFARFKENVLFYEHYVKMKRLVKEGKLSEVEWLIPALHILLGCREGWGTITHQGKKLSDVKLDEAPSSLIGLKWRDAIFDANGKIIGFHIYEHKTEKVWSLRYNWLDPDILVKVTEIYRKMNPKPEESVVKTILRYYGINIDTVAQFANWYKKVLKKISKELDLPWTLTPHDMRRAHLSIMADLEIPLEIALKDTGFGVGWDDIKTAVDFYLRISSRRINRIIQRAEEIKKTIESQLS